MLDIFRGRMTVDGPNGGRRFDTSDQMFHITDKITGSLSFPERIASGGVAISGANDYVLGPCHADANHVEGAINVTYGSGSGGDLGLPGFGWFAIGGTYLHVLDGATIISFSVQRRESQQVVAYTFVAVGGQVILQERYYIRIESSSTIYGVRAFTMQYRLRAGRFN